MHPSSKIERLIEIMAALRHPETGCPWDVAQDFSSVAPYTVEEAYEVADAIERDDMEDLRDELGDLLLQVVFHARMAEEAGHFAFEDVVRTITAKMIRRHPHVFGDEKARARGMAKGMWEEIKAREKAEKAARRAVGGNGAARHPPAHLDEVPRALPALMRAAKLQSRAARVGFDWGETGPVIDKIEEEIGELREALNDGDSAHIGEEYGDLLFALANLGRHLGHDPEAALAAANDKFRKRFDHIERTLAAEERSLEDAGLAEMEAIWQHAKTVK